MGGGTRHETTTTSSNNEPWSAAQPFLRDTMQVADDYRKSGQSGQAVEFDPLTRQGMGYSRAIAQHNMAGPNSLIGIGSQMVEDGGYSPAQQNAMGAFERSMENLNPFASGENLGAQNPMFRESVNNALQDTRDQIDMTMSGAGRYGSGSHTGVLADRLGRVSTDAYARQFENDRNAMFAANQMQQGLAGDMFNAGQTAFDNVGRGYDLSMRPMETLMSLGGMEESMEANRRMAPWEDLARANAIFSGAGAMGGTAQQTVRAPTLGQSPFATAAGYGLGGLGLLGSFM